MCLIRIGTENKLLQNMVERTEPILIHCWPPSGTAIAITCTMSDNYDIVYIYICIYHDYSTEIFDTLITGRCKFTHLKCVILQQVSFSYNIIYIYIV